ncbi:hypothetical protein CAAN1_10S05908 [[Candida] anglica]|uniref:Uncharacterized protein n=1 Tax=[Candida] anglica TaxID=148631 RepID=A0ABP0EIG8_9ASCO
MNLPSISRMSLAGNNSFDMMSWPIPMIILVVLILVLITPLKSFCRDKISSLHSSHFDDRVMSQKLKRKLSSLGQYNEKLKSSRRLATSTSTYVDTVGINARLDYSNTLYFSRSGQQVCETTHQISEYLWKFTQVVDRISATISDVTSDPNPDLDKTKEAIDKITRLVGDIDPIDDGHSTALAWLRVIYMSMEAMKRYTNIPEDEVTSPSPLGVVASEDTDPLHHVVSSLQEQAWPHLATHIVQA